MRQDPTLKPSERTFQHGTKLGRLINTAVPVPLLFTYLWIEHLCTLPQILQGILGVGLTFMVIGPLIPRAARRLNGTLIETIDAIAEGRPVEPERLERSRRTVFLWPWRAAGVGLVMWGVLMPSVIFLSLRAFGGTPPYTILLSGLVFGPLMATMCLFSFDLFLRSCVATLFPEGGVDRYQDRWTLTIRKKFTIIYFFLGPFSLQLLSWLAFRDVSTSPSVAVASQRLMTLQLFITFCTTSILAFLILYTKKGIGIPLADVVDALQAVQRGNLDVRLPIESRDNIGLVSESFNHMVAGLQEKERLREAFGRYVAPEIAERAVHAPLLLGGETRTVSVLFSDVRNFTAMSETMDPQALVDLMNRYFEAMVACIRLEGGSVNKFIGDGIMALFGAPSPHEDHAHAAVQAALAMERALKGFNAEQRELGLPELAIGVGIATGPVVVGNVGSRDRLEYTAIGDTVNTASRIEGLNKELGTTILFDETTSLLIGDRVEVREQGGVKVKGKSDPVCVYAPEGSKAPVR